MKQKVIPNLFEKECPRPKTPHVKSDQKKELRDSTKCEVERTPHKTRERKPPYTMPHNHSDKRENSTQN
jgi:hypothetical protein